MYAPNRLLGLRKVLPAGISDIPVEYPISRWEKHTYCPGVLEVEFDVKGLVRGYWRRSFHVPFKNSPPRWYFRHEFANGQQTFPTGGIILKPKYNRTPSRTALEKAAPTGNYTLRWRKRSPAGIFWNGSLPRKRVKAPKKKTR